MGSAPASWQSTQLTALPTSPDSRSRSPLPDKSVEMPNNCDRNYEPCVPPPRGGSDA